VSSSREVRQLSVGDNFGEVALVTHSVRTAWVRADSYVLVSVLARDCIEPIWEHFPEQKEELVKEIGETAKADQNRAAARIRKSLGQEMAEAGISMKPAYCFTAGPITQENDLFRIGFGESAMPDALEALKRFLVEHRQTWVNLRQ